MWSAPSFSEPSKTQRLISPAYILHVIRITASQVQKAAAFPVTNPERAIISLTVISLCDYNSGWLSQHRQCQQAISLKDSRYPGRRTVFGGGGGAEMCVGAGLDRCRSHWDIKQARGSESQ